MGLDEKEKSKTILEIVYMFKNERDADAQVRMVNALRYLNAGSYVIIPLIEAVKQNKHIQVYTSITGFIREIEPAAEDKVSKLIEFLKDDKWEVRLLALNALGKMSKKAKKAVPEIIKTMQKFGDNPERYEKVFDILAMINNEIAIIALIADAENKDSKIRKNAVEKLFELQAYLSPKLKIKKEIIPALIRALYSKDKNISEFAEDALRETGSPEAQKALENYLKIGKRAIKILVKAAGKSMEDVFKSRKEKIIKKLEDFYKEIGELDEFKKLKEGWE